MKKDNLLKEKIELFLISSLGLFLQMACIRWLPSQVQILAYYTNLVLLAAFLGLGVGYLLVPRKFKFIYIFPLVLSFMMLMCFILSKAEVGHSTNIEFWQTVISPKFSIPLKWLIPLFFILVAFLFIPLGKQTGALFDVLEPISAYSINILGSVCGIIVYSLLSYNLLPPLWLFGSFMVIYLYFIYTRTSKVFFIVTAVLFVSILLWINYNDRGTFWSPYYKIRLSTLNKQSTWNDGFNLTVNNDYHQMALNLSNDKVKKDKGLWEWANLYELPFKLKNNIDDALIVGAGTGNDVSGAIRQKVKHIDAVDIDPLIIKIGKKHHPELPYSNKNVSVIVDDARSYFKKTDKKYDVIVFGFLDSHQLFSSMSSLRLDTYVYTVESIKEAKKLLKPDGIISLTFCVTKPWIGNRLARIMEEATGKEPIMVSSGKEPNGFTYIYSEQPLDLKSMREYDILSPSVFGTKQVMSSKDDWPFFYLKTRSIPADYWMFILFILIISIIFVSFTGSLGIGRFQPSFFFLGAGFLLFETKSITHMSLLFGSTWIVNSAVFIAIFVTVLIANLFVLKIKVNNLKKYYFLLFIAFAVNYFFPIHLILSYGLIIKFISAGILIGLPIFFSGVIFVTKFKNSSQRSIAMGSNLIGAMLGGVMEYSSMIIGFKNLTFLIVIFYVASMFKFSKKD